MHTQLKRWLKILACLIMVIGSISVGFSTFLISGGNEKVSNVLSPSFKNVVPSAYFENNPDKLYTIEDALDIAGNNNVSDTIYVKPGTNPVITRDCTIASDDTLCIPYEGKNWKQLDFQANPSQFSDRNYDSVIKNRKNFIRIQTGVTLTNNGTLQLGGQTGSYSSACAGMTNGMYCEINMEPKSQIISKGTFSCFGYVKESEFISEDEIEKEAIVSITNGVLDIPFIVHDYKGGTQTVSRYKGGNVCPFEVIDVVNIQALFKFFYPSKMHVYADLYASDQHNNTDFDLFAPSNALLNFDEGAYVTSKFLNKGFWEEKNGLNFSYTPSITTYSLTANAKVDDLYRVHNKLCLYGTFSLNDMTMKINPMNVGDISISTASVLFPISYRLEAHIFGTLNCNNKYELLGGAKVYIEDSGVFNNNADFLIYGDNVSYTNSVTIDGVTHSIVNSYPTYFKGISGKLYIAGKYIQKSGAFGGNPFSMSSNAVLDLKGATSCSLSTGEYGYKSLDGTSEKLKFLTNSVLPGFKTPSTLIEQIDVVSKADVSLEINGNLQNVKLLTKSVYQGNSINDASWHYSEIEFSIGYDYPSKASANNDGVFSFDVSLTNLPSDDKRTYDVSSIQWNLSSDNSNCTLKSNSFKGTEKITVSGNVSKKGTYHISISASIKDTLPSNKIHQLNLVRTTIDATSCLLPETPVLMADMTYKKVEDIKKGDLVMSFNHFTRQIEPTTVILNAESEREAAKQKVLSLEFSDGKKIGVIGNHGFFDLEENKYVYINAENYSNYINHKFYGIEDGSLNRKDSILISGSVRYEVTKIYSPVTANNLNIITAGKLSISGEIDGLFNIFEYEKSSPKYDEDKMNEDISRYGLLSYEYFKNQLTYEQYQSLPCKYMSIAINKGLITWSQIQQYIKTWGPYLL